MDTTPKIKPYWLTMHPNRLHTYLRERLHMDDATAGQVMALAIEERAKLKSRKAKRTAAQRLWDDVLDPARYELATIRTMKAQTKAAKPLNKAKWEALCVYEDTIHLWITKLKQVRRAGEHTPKQFAAALREAGKPIANDGTHWADYIPQRTRQPVRDAFAALPPPKRGKTKTPFARTLPPSMRETQRVALAKEIDNTLAATQREREVTENPDEQGRLDARILRLHEAQYRLDKYPKQQMFPTSWEALLGD